MILLTILSFSQRFKFNNKAVHFTLTPPYRMSIGVIHDSGC